MTTSPQVLPEPEPSATAATEFVESSNFCGARPGYVFANRDGRVGYHRDQAIGSAVYKDAAAAAGICTVQGTIEGPAAEFLDFQVPADTIAGATIILQVRHAILLVPFGLQRAWAWANE